MTITIRTKAGDKQYSTVAERLAMLHESGKTLEVRESGPVQVGDGWIWRVLIKVDDLTYVGNAQVHLDSTNFAEKADPWATAETSAIGRAIVWSGYAGTPETIASADEVLRTRPTESAHLSDSASDELPAIKHAVRSLGLAHNPQQWAAWKKRVLGRDVADSKLTVADLAKMESEVIRNNEAA